MGILEKGRVLPLVRLAALCIAGAFLMGADFFKDEGGVDFFSQERPASPGKNAAPSVKNVPNSKPQDSRKEELYPERSEGPLLPEVRDVIRRVENNLEDNAVNEKRGSGQIYPTASKAKECDTCLPVPWQTGGGNIHTEENTGFKENVLYYFFAPDCPYCSNATRAMDKFYRVNRGTVEVEGVIVTNPDQAIQHYQEWIAGYGDFNDVPGYPISVSYTKAQEMGIKEIPAFVLTVNGRTCRATGQIDIQQFYSKCMEISKENRS